MLSRDALDSFLSSDEKPFPPDESAQARKKAYAAQFNESLQSVANCLVAHAKEKLKKGERIDPMRYLFWPAAYKYKDAAQFNKVVSLAPHMEEVIGPSDAALDIVKKEFEAAFPGFRIVVAKAEYVWSFDIDINFN